MLRQYDLVERVRAYDPAADEDALNRAYVWSMQLHGSQKRENGDPYFSHPVEVAGLLTEMKLDWATIVTGLLHDTLEDTEATRADVERLFGPEVARLVDGVTKLSRIEFQSSEAKQAENFRKLVLATAEDIRVLLVKLADRTHNMRTLHFVRDPDRRRRIARETLEIYAPLADRMGIHRLKDELEDLAFAELNPEARNSILRRLEYLRKDGVGLVEDLLERLRTLLSQEGFAKLTVTGREKSPFSIWRKMQSKNVGFEQLSDIMAFRVTLFDIGDCYRALGLVHGAFPVVPGRFKDYISTPKPNGYRSIHTTVLAPSGPGQSGQRIEIQIRTHDMHEQAELGVAAHWAYKEGSKRPDTSDHTQFRWLRELLELVEHAHRPEEFLEHTKLELYQDQVFCFTPRGDLIALPRGATAVDFAYAVHSDIGDHCVGAKVNGRLVPLSSKLATGDQVEIATSRTQTPSPAWESFVATGKARARIRRFIRLAKRDEYVRLGRAMAEKLWRQEGYAYADKAVAAIAHGFKGEDAEDVLAAIGEGLVGAREVFNAVFPGHRHAQVASAASGPAAAQALNGAGGPGLALPVIAPAPVAKKKAKADKPLPLKGLIPGLAVHYARCCHPVPGDRIVGIVTTGKGVTVHTIDCETLETFAEAPERWLDIAWNDGAERGAGTHTARVEVTLANEPGSLGTLSTVIAKSGGNITNLRVANRQEDFWDLVLDVDVPDTRGLADIMAALRAQPVVSSVARARR